MSVYCYITTWCQKNELFWKLAKTFLMNPLVSCILLFKSAFIYDTLFYVYIHIRHHWKAEIFVIPFIYANQGYIHNSRYSKHFCQMTQQEK